MKEAITLDVYDIFSQHYPLIAKTSDRELFDSAPQDGRSSLEGSATIVVRHFLFN
jgi:hypothetical protein